MEVVRNLKSESNAKKKAPQSSALFLLHPPRWSHSYRHISQSQSYLRAQRHQAEFGNLETRALDVVVLASASGEYARFHITAIHDCMRCRWVQGLYRRIDIGSPASTKNSWNLYRQAADTKDFDNSSAPLPANPYRIGGPPIRCRGEKWTQSYRQPADTT